MPVSSVSSGAFTSLSSLWNFAGEAFVGNGAAAVEVEVPTGRGTGSAEASEKPKARRPKERGDAKRIA